MGDPLLSSQDKEMFLEKNLNGSMIVVISYEISISFTQNCPKYKIMFVVGQYLSEFFGLKSLISSTENLEGMMTLIASSVPSII